MNGSGQCLCGAVTFEAKDIESHVHACHCSMCRRWNDGPALAASVGSVNFSGEENITRYESSEWAERGFCNKCGSNLFYFLKPDRYIMWAGLFSDQAFELDGEIFCEDKPSWYNFAGDHPRHDQMPDMPES
ncbi:MAG: GFA family protein [Pseudomonadales bacterium]|jgi:hypothetical protein|nr:GFA family protein [Pseudomonadales bacterium]